MGFAANEKWYNVTQFHRRTWSKWKNPHLRELTLLDDNDDNVRASTKFNNDMLVSLLTGKQAGEREQEEKHTIA